MIADVIIENQKRRYRLSLIMNYKEMQYDAELNCLEEDHKGWSKIFLPYKKYKELMKLNKIILLT